MDPNPSGTASAGGSLQDHRNHPLQSAESIGYEENVPEVAIPSMPMLPSIPAEEESFSDKDYFSPLTTTTSVPLPATADLFLGLRQDDSISGGRSEGSAISTPLTSISSASFLVDSSASTSHTIVTSIYSNSPTNNPSNRPAPQPAEFDHPTRSSAHHNLYFSTPWPHPGTQHVVSETTSTAGPSTARGGLSQFAPFSSSETVPSLRVPAHSVQGTFTPPNPSQRSFTSQYPIQHPIQARLEHLHSPTTQGTNSEAKPDDNINLSRFQSPLFQPRNQEISPPPRSPLHRILNVYEALRQPTFPPDVFAAPVAVPFTLQGPFLGTSIARDALLAYAHRLYNDPTHPPPLGMTPIPHLPESDVESLTRMHHRQLVPLLESIRSQHPRHLPTLLLLSCVQYSIGDYDACQNTCGLILSIDPNYVEAMSNLGMVKRANGANGDAEAWWKKAIRLRPTYWDAIDNLLHVLCESGTLQSGTVLIPRYQEALHVLEYVLNILIRSDGLLLVFISPAHLHRLQNLLYTSGNLRSIISENSRAGTHDYIRALELAFRDPGAMDLMDPIRFRDVILATVVVGLLASRSPHSHILNIIADALGVDPARFTNNSLERSIDWLSLVHRAGQTLVDALLREGHGVLPLILLSPEKAARIAEVLFDVYARSLPALCIRSSYEDPWQLAPGANTSAMNKVTSNILLTLAKILLHGQDLRHFGGLLNPGEHIPPSQSLVLIFYYLSISLNPNPSTYNNMGILFFGIKQSANTINAHGQHEMVSGPVLAQMYYRKGLSMDPQHPHLLTNYGSLLKDQGRSLEAIKLYEKALIVKPDFEVALVNIANAVKDQGRLSDAIAYYQRALIVSPDSSEAICGLVNALSSICDWRWGRGSIGNEPIVDEQTQFHMRSDTSDTTPHGWMGRLEIVTKGQLQGVYRSASGIFSSLGTFEQWKDAIEKSYGASLAPEQTRCWKLMLSRFYTSLDRWGQTINEIGFLIRFVEMLNRITQRRWYHDLYGDGARHSQSGDSSSLYRRIRIPETFEPPPVPSVLPFHTFTYALDVRDIRLVAHRNALRISFDTLMAPWLPETVYQPPSPPSGKLNIGYVSSDFNNHPLAHLMLSVFALHNRLKFNIYAYATTSSDDSHYRHRIEQGVDTFRDVSTSSTQAIAKQIVDDQIHILVNLGGYTKAARNDIFAARASPIQVSLMGYAATSGAGWSDYLIGDVHACPKDAFEPYFSSMRKKAGVKVSRLADCFQGLDGGIEAVNDESDPEAPSNEWSFTEKFLHMPHSYFATDHRQAFPEDHFAPGMLAETVWLSEERLRHRLRKEIFPELQDDVIIFACFSQLYKICPSAFFTWLRILQRVPGSILWLLRFPSAGEEHLLRAATLWAGPEVASRVRFTDVAHKDAHVRRCRVADLFLDTFQCNAHTIAADVLWSGTPILTWPKEHLKMCTRVASSIVYATGFGDQMIAKDLHSYEERAVNLAHSVSYRTVPNPEGGFDRRGSGELMELRKNLFLHRDKMPLFDTERWVRNLEKGFEALWDHWVNSCRPPWTEREEDGGCITLTDDQPFFTG